MKTKCFGDFLLEYTQENHPAMEFIHPELYEHLTESERTKVNELARNVTALFEKDRVTPEQVVAFAEICWEKHLIAQIRPSDGWVGHCGPYPEFSGTEMFKDKFDKVFPRSTEQWEPVKSRELPSDLIPLGRHT